MKIGKFIRILITIFGFVALAYLTVCAFLLMGKEQPFAFVAMTIITIVFLLLMFVLVKLKKQENHLKVFRIIEVGVLFVYFVVAVVVYDMTNFNKNFMVRNEKENLTEKARNDLTYLEGQLDSISYHFDDILVRTQEGLKIAQGKNHSQNLEDFFNNHPSASICKDNGENDYCDYVKMRFGEIYTHTDSLQIANIMSETERKLDSWSLYEIYSIGENINNISNCQTALAANLDSLFGLRGNDSYELPKINDTNTIDPYFQTIVQYDIIGYYNDFNKYKADTTKIQFPNVIMRPAEPFAPISGIIVYIVIHLAILLSYIVANRTTTISAGKHIVDDGGIIIN